jgi:hypothetical protein
VLHCLGSCDFADLFATHFHVLFQAIVDDPHIKETITHCFKHSGRDQLRISARKRHTALADAILRHVTDHELHCLEDVSSHRAKVTLELTEIVFERLQNLEHFPDVRRST